MSKTSSSYCKSKSIKKMGFSQIASCKAQGLISRSSRENRGKYVKSPKYRTSINRKKKSRKIGKTSRKNK